MISLIVETRCPIQIWILFKIQYFLKLGDTRHVLSGWRNVRPCFHDDVIKWKHFPRCWPLVRGIHRSPVNSPHKGQWRGALMFSLICAWINGWVNNRGAGDFRRHCAHYDVTVLWPWHPNAGLLSFGPLGTNLSEILIKIRNFSFTKLHLKISSATWRLFCPGEVS